MSFTDFLTFWGGNMVVSVLVWSAIAMALVYLARNPAHRMIEAFAAGAKQAFQQAADAVQASGSKLAERNKEVLVAAGREASERLIEREFSRIDTIVHRDMAEYPTLHRKISDVVTRIDEDYKTSSEVPPEAPGWANAVQAVAKIPTGTNDPMVGQVLQSIHGSMEKSHQRVLEEYRKSSRTRHMLLKKMRPFWRRMDSDLKQVNQKVTGLLERAEVIDRKMEEYENIVSQTDSAVRTLSSSSLTQFFVAGFVLAVAIGGAMINFNLIARPMQEMVGGSAMLMGYRTANIAALVIILVEVAMGLFLMESLRITRLFPVIGSMRDEMRVRMIWITFTILLILASVEAGLAYMREILSQDDAALRASLIQGNVTAMAVNSQRWITTAAQMGMGFILPFALVFVAIPLESFIHSSRTVLGMVGVGLLRGLAFVLSLIGNISHYLGQMLISIYDLFIFLPLWIEDLVRGKESRESREGKRGFNPFGSRTAKEEA
ncbi:MAG TPA: hypothetical protein VNI58_10415 [Mariprofundaceae bacterium]|nr:hypothetical protein [Mariprofundaceae bacterium]